MSGSTHHGNGHHWPLALIPLSLFLFFTTLIGRVAHGDIPIWSWAWVPQLNITLSFHADGLGLLMALIVSGIGTLIFIYASGYMAGDPQINRFYAILTLFMLAMLGVVLADNLILLFIFWELTSISSYLLIGFKHDKADSQRSALQALLVTGSGGMCLMAGLVLLGLAADSWQLSEIIYLGEQIQSSALYLPALMLILLGAFTKSAQFPFHFWLPNAMAAPTPVSAYLHSATMVKAGVYLLARLNPALGQNEIWFYTLVIFGGVTGLVGGWLAWQQVDLKRIMAYSTISALGVLVFLIGLGSTYAYEAAMLFLLVHSLYKGALFMTAGAIDHSTGTRDIRQLRGLWRTMPFTFVGVLLATTSMAGVPPLLGFVGKELIYKSTVESYVGSVALTTTAVVTNILVVGAGAIILFVPFFRKETEREAGVNPPPHHPHAASLTLWIGPVVLGVLALLSGLFVGSEFFSEMLMAPAVSSLAGQAVEVHLHLIPPVFDIVPLLSLVTVLLGLGVYAVHERFRGGMQWVDGRVSRFGPENGYFGLLEGVLWFAGQVTKLLQNGHLRNYILMVAFTLLGLVGGYSVIGRIGWHWSSMDLRPYEFVVGITIIFAALFILKTGSRLGAVIGLGIIGYGIAYFYLFFGAPDLAMTQFSIETLTVILFVLVLFRLPRFLSLTDNMTKIRDGVIATAVGLTMTLLVLTDLDVPTNLEIANFYAEAAYDLAHGRNVVNVILVDFRGLDTMVEVTVLAVAALGVYALIKATRRYLPKRPHVPETLPEKH